MAAAEMPPVVAVGGTRRRILPSANGRRGLGWPFPIGEGLSGSEFGSPPGSFLHRFGAGFGALGGG